MASSEPIATPPRSSRIERTTRIAFRSLSSTFLAAGTFAAFAWLLGFWSLVMRARISSGAWPEPRSTVMSAWPPVSVDPDAFTCHTHVVWVELMLMYYAVPFALLVVLASVPLRSMRQDRRLVGAFSVSTSLAAVTVFLDPGGFFLWFLD